MHVRNPENWFVAMMLDATFKGQSRRKFDEIRDLVFHSPFRNWSVFSKNHTGSS